MKFRMTPVAAALATLFVMPSVSSAQEAPVEAAPTESAVPAEATASATPRTAVELPAVKVQGQTQNEYKPEKPASTKYTEPLRDIPQTIQIIPAKVIEDQNQLTLRQMLSNVPGITFGAAEGGNGFGDNITFRGARIENDIQLDGLRDSAQTARTDPFNLEQLEVTKGASSVYSGSGAVTGTINQVSKTAKADDFTKASLGVGTDAYTRFTADANRKLSENSAFRINLMTHKNDSPERDEVWSERWGVAGSLALGIGTDTRATLNVLHQDSERVPDRGVLWRRAANPGQGAPVPVDRSTYFGFSNVDRENATVDVFTAIIEKDLSETVTLRNTTRHATTKNDSTIATLNGLACIDGVPFNATGTCPTPTEGVTNTWSPSGNSLIPGNLRDDETTLDANVTELSWNLKSGGVEHSIVAGLALTRESFDRNTRQARKADGTAFDTSAADADGLAAAAITDLDNPNRIWAGPLNWVTTTTNENTIDNHAIYVFDTVKFSEAWQFSAGLRAERNEANYRSFSATTATDADSKDTLISGRLGLTYKPAQNGSIYVAYGNSEAPSSTSVIASCSATGSNQNCNLDPEETISYEIGTKWDLLDQKLAVTAALFRNDRTNMRVNSGDPEVTVQVLDGEARVDGIELSATGQITDKWSIYAGFALLRSEVLQSVASAQAAANVVDAQKGNDIPSTPEQSGSLWTSYKLPAGFEVGYGLTYTGEYKTEGTDVTTTVPSSTVQNALIGWTATRELDLRLNINNLANEQYWSAVRPHGWAHPGEGRSFVLTANYSF